MTEDTSFEALLQESATRPRHKPLKVGAQVTGTVVAIDAEQIFVDVGAKTEARMERSGHVNEAGELTLAVGDVVNARITGMDNGTLILGSRQTRVLHGQAELESAYRQGQPVEGQITAVIKGGLEVQIAGQRAFCPASQADLRFVEDLSPLVGERHSFRITKLTLGRNLNLVVSRRAILEEQQAARVAELRAQLKPGAVLSGTVTSLQDYGAFVDLGGIEGMIHISELAPNRIRHPQEVVTVGQTLEVAVLRIEPSTKAGKPDRIALSLRAVGQATQPEESRPAAAQSQMGTFGELLRAQLNQRDERS